MGANYLISPPMTSQLDMKKRGNLRRNRNQVKGVIGFSYNLAPGKKDLTFDCSRYL